MAGHSPYSPSINIQKSPLKQHIRARDVRVVAFAVTAFDVTVAGHVVAAVPTSKVG
ncbi:hypothetical protein TIFTF001_021018 [Ficus carica]|uniref:Uncharacterized protein n=1 Tax=Ficus carica TaxID=3494 RepID=A0AA88AEX0_FICCA|nr:hypothetical protein TIFTF001_021018 [Ficus carica]